MSELSNPHDHFFKQVLARPEAARDLLLNYLPAEVVALLDLTSLELRKDSFVDAELREHFSDLLYQVKLKDEREAYVYVLLEHKSYPDGLVAFQLLRYLVRIWKQSLWEVGESPLAPIIPMVVYHGKAAWQVGLDFGSLFEGPDELEPYWPQFQYELCDLTAYSDEEIQGEVILRTGLLLMKHIFRDDLEERLPEILVLLRDLAEQKTGLEYLETMLRYVAQGTDRVSEKGLRKAVETALAAEGGRTMRTLAEKWLEQGREQGLKQGMEQGLQQGMQQGMQQGLREGLLSGIELGLELKFGSAGVHLLPEIYKIEDMDVLRAIREGLKHVDTPEELRRIYQYNGQDQ